MKSLAKAVLELHADKFKLRTALSRWIGLIKTSPVCSTSAGLKCIHKFQKSNFSQTNAKIQLSLAVRKHTVWHAEVIIPLLHFIKLKLQTYVYFIGI